MNVSIIQTTSSDHDRIVVFQTDDSGLEKLVRAKSLLEFAQYVLGSMGGGGDRRAVSLESGPDVSLFGISMADLRSLVTEDSGPWVLTVQHLGGLSRNEVLVERILGNNIVSAFIDFDQRAGAHTAGQIKSLLRTHPCMKLSVCAIADKVVRRGFAHIEACPKDTGDEFAFILSSVKNPQIVRDLAFQLADSNRADYVLVDKAGARIGSVPAGSPSGPHEPTGHPLPKGFLRHGNSSLRDLKFVYRLAQDGTCSCIQLGGKTSLIRHDSSTGRLREPIVIDMDTCQISKWIPQPGTQECAPETKISRSRRGSASSPASR